MEAMNLQPDNQCGQGYEYRHQWHNVVTLHDIADDLIGIDEVVDGNEVIANAKLLPKEILTGSDAE